MEAHATDREIIELETSAETFNHPKNGRSDTEEGPEIAPHEENDPPSTSVEAYPEVGLEAWSVVFGAFCALFMVFGMVNSTAVFQEYFTSHQLRGYSQAQIGWIFSLNLFLVFFCGIYSGRVFDAHGPRLLIALGSLAITLSLFLLEFCTTYWHFLLDYAVLGGLGGALLMTPAFASIGHFFKRRRGLATGIANTAGSIAGVIIPLLLRSILPKLGFSWSCRTLGFLFLALSLPANLLIKTRLAPSAIRPRNTASRLSRARTRLLPEFSAVLDPGFALCTAGVFVMEWGLFLPLSYISLYTTAQGQSPSFGYTVVMLLNAGSFFGRWIPGLLADRLGRFNVIIGTIFLCVVAVLALWLPAGDSAVLVIVFAVCFGFASGSNLALIPVCISQLCRVEDYGKYFSTAYFIASFGTLTSVPIGGGLLNAAHGDYLGLILFSGFSYLGALGFYTASRVCAVGWSVRRIF